MLAVVIIFPECTIIKAASALHISGLHFVEFLLRQSFERTTGRGMGCSGCSHFSPRLNLPRAEEVWDILLTGCKQF